MTGRITLKATNGNCIDRPLFFFQKHPIATYPWSMRMVETQPIWRVNKKLIHFWHDVNNNKRIPCPLPERTRSLYHGQYHQWIFVLGQLSVNVLELTQIGQSYHPVLHERLKQKKIPMNFDIGANQMKWNVSIDSFYFLLSKLASYIRNRLRH